MKLIQGDCLRVMSQLEPRSVDLILTDPPYGTTAASWDSVVPFPDMWQQLNRIIKPGGAIVLFGSQPFTTQLISSNLPMFRYLWYWKKTQHSNPFIASIQPLRIIEDIAVFCRTKPPYYVKTTETSVQHGVKRSDLFNGTKRAYTQTKTGWPRNVLEYKRDRGYHPTQKPVALLEYLISIYTKEGDTVLDFTMGSGSTGVAAKNTNRDFIGIEISREYCEVAASRILN